MLEIILAFSWVLIGIITAGYMLYDHNKHGNDITVSDILGGIAVASTGPIIATIAVIVVLSDKLDGITDRVLIKGKKG